MRYGLLRFDVGRDPHASAGSELSLVIICVVAACATIVAVPTLVALTYGWDHRLAVMLGAVLAVGLARIGWRRLPAERVADRLTLAFAGTLAAALLCAYASDWLDWRPLDFDDAVAGMAIGLLLLLLGPVRQGARVPTAVGAALIVLALAPAGWAGFLYEYHGDALGHAAKYWRIELPGFGVSLLLSALGFGFALRRGLQKTAIVLGLLAGWDLGVIVSDYDGSSFDPGLVDGIAGAGLIMAGAYACMRAARSASLSRWASVPVGALLAGLRRRALRATVRRPTAAGLAAAALGFTPVAWWELVDAFDYFDLPTADGCVLIVLPGLALGVVLAALAVLFTSQRLYRATLLTAAIVGAQILRIGYLLDADIVTAVFAVAATVGVLVLAATAAWRAYTNAAPARPAGLVVLLALASVVAFMHAIEPLEYFSAAAALGVWSWFYERRAVPLVASGTLERTGRCQALLRLALAAAFGITLGLHLVLLQAAVRNQTGAMVLAELAKRHLYRVSDVTFTRAILADQYLWRDSVSPARSARVETHASRLLEASRHPRDQWSDSAELWWVRLFEKEHHKGYGVETGPYAPGGRLVTYVYGGSPAQRAGVRRGDVIRAIDGVALDGPNVPWLPSFKGPTRVELVSAAGEAREVTVAPAKYKRSAVSIERVVDVAGRKVGYLELNNFDKGANLDFLNAAERLREQGIDELVLDLRRNPGGGVYTSLRIASAIGGKRLDGKIFKRLVHNDRYRDRDRDLVFSTPSWGALSLPRVFIITSEETCSASEGLINGLAPHMEVVTIGGTTCGKPVGSTVLEYGEREYSVVTFRSINARGEGDYYNGLRPTCGADNDVRRDFGDPEEASFKAALHYIRHGRCPEPSVWL